jgi:hypothetical protein
MWFVARLSRRHWCLETAAPAAPVAQLLRLTQAGSLPRHQHIWPASRELALSLASAYKAGTVRALAPPSSPVLALAPVPVQALALAPRLTPSAT